MSDKLKIGEANAGFTKAEPLPRSVELARASMMRFEAQKAADRDELTEKGRAALSALIAWRAADLAVLECLKVPREERAGKWDEAHTDAVNRRIAAIEALRAAADEVTKEG